MRTITDSRGSKLSLNRQMEVSAKYGWCEGPSLAITPTLTSLVWSRSFAQLALFSRLLPRSVRKKD